MYRALQTLVIAASAGLASAQVSDGSFEATGPLYPDPGAWQQSSTNFGTPLCDGACFGPGEPSAARTGQWWAWFGGTDTAIERGTLSQSITIPPGPATLRFHLTADSDRNNATDYLKVLIDGVPIFAIYDHQLTPYTSAYLAVSLDITAHAGGTRLLTFDSQTHGAGFITNFFVDDVEVLAGTQPTCYPNCDQSTVIPVLTANDFQCFLDNYAAQSPYANCDNSTNVPLLTANDFQCYLNRFAAGCT